MCNQIGVGIFMARVEMTIKKAEARELSTDWWTINF